MIITNEFKKYESLKDLACSVKTTNVGGEGYISFENPFDDSHLMIHEWADTESIEDPDGSRGFHLIIEYNKNIDELDGAFYELLKKALIYLKKNKKDWEYDEDTYKGQKSIDAYCISNDIDYTSDESFDKSARKMIYEILDNILD